VTVSGECFEFLAGQMINAETQWSLGTFGAIAEFMRDLDEPFAFQRGKASLTVTTARGGMRIKPPAEMRLVAFETPTRESWSNRVALCLPETQCGMSRRTVLTELGPDDGALRDQDRDSILFDLGIDALQTDLCVRIADDAVAAQLREHAGRSLFEPGNPAIGVILANSPHRVFIGRVGRVEVYQPIPDPHGKSPQGPHTHVLPNLLQHRRTHAATEQIPDGWVPCAHLYPPHPVMDGLGQRRPFDRARHEAFQNMLRMFGDPEFFALKQRVVAAVAAGEDPSVVAVTGQRFARTNVRVTLRQLKAAQEETPSLAAWMAAHERAGEIENDEDRHRHHR
jgi:Family of unknown function (DUF6925)